MVPFLDLTAQYRTIAAEVEPALLRVASSGRYILGEEGERFEAEFARHVGVDHAIGVSSGLDALRLALLSLDLGPGDEVITPASTFIATALAISGVGARPVLADVDEATGNLDPEAVERALTSRTRAIMPVHLYGLPTDMEPLARLAQQHGLFMVEDACQAHGAGIDERRAGSFGDLACFSFYPGKNLGAMGDGGMITTRRGDLAERLRRLRNYGQERKYHHVEIGANHRLDEIQAAVLRVKLRHLDDWNRARRTHAAAYDRGLAGLPLACPAVPAGRTHVFHLYVIRTPRRDELQTFLDRRGITTLIHYPVPIHLQPAYASMNLPVGSFPRAEARASEILSLPMYAELTGAQIDQVTAAIREWLGSPGSGPRSPDS